MSGLSPQQVDRYLDRIGMERPEALDVHSLESLQRAHLTAIPFENLHVFRQIPVSTSAAWSIDKIVNGGRGGWCFELNGAFGELLSALGFNVIRLGAAVLLDGPNTMIDHLALEVGLDRPYLVDVGFGNTFIRPLDLSTRSAQDGGVGSFAFMPSPHGTTLTEDDDGVPRALYRFKRVAHELTDFEPASTLLQGDPERHWRQRPFLTRLLDGGPDRVTLLEDRLKISRGSDTTETTVSASDWEPVMREWFDMGWPS